MLAGAQRRRPLIDQEQRLRAALQQQGMLLGPGGSRVRHHDVEPGRQLVEQLGRPLHHRFAVFEMARCGQQRRHPTVRPQLIEARRHRQHVIDGQRVLHAHERRGVAELQVEIQQQGVVAHPLRDERRQYGHRALARAAASADHWEKEPGPRARAALVAPRRLGRGRRSNRDGHRRRHRRLPRGCGRRHGPRAGEGLLATRVALGQGLARERGVNARGAGTCAPPLPRRKCAANPVQPDSLPPTL